jgi:hypothetical protein
MAVLSSRLDTVFHQQNLGSVYTGIVQGGQAVAVVGGRTDGPPAAPAAPALEKASVVGTKRGDSAR